MTQNSTVGKELVVCNEIISDKHKVVSKKTIYGEKISSQIMSRECDNASFAFCLLRQLWYKQKGKLIFAVTLYCQKKSPYIKYLRLPPSFLLSQLETLSLFLNEFAVDLPCRISYPVTTTSFEKSPFLISSHSLFSLSVCFSHTILKHHQPMA